MPEPFSRPDDSYYDKVYSVPKLFIISYGGDNTVDRNLYLTWWIDHDEDLISVDELALTGEYTRLCYIDPKIHPHIELKIKDYV